MTEYDSTTISDTQPRKNMTTMGKVDVMLLTITFRWFLVLVIVFVLSQWWFGIFVCHYDDVIMSAIASQITSLTIVYSTVYSGADQSKHQSSASLAFVWGIHRGPVNSTHKWPVTRKMFPFDDVIMVCFGEVSDCQPLWWTTGPTGVKVWEPYLNVAIQFPSWWH